jgi:hypothetical protein
MTNQLQICNWLVNHPTILRLASEMLAAKSNAPSSSLTTTQIAAPSPDNVLSIMEIYNGNFLIS